MSRDQKISYSLEHPNYEWTSSIENLSKSKNPKNPEIEPSNPSILDFEKSQDSGWFSLKKSKLDISRSSWMWFSGTCGKSDFRKFFDVFDGFLDISYPFPDIFQTLERLGRVQTVFDRFESNINLLNQLEKRISIIEQWLTAVNLEDCLNTVTEQILRFSDSYYFDSI